MGKRSTFTITPQYAGRNLKLLARPCPVCGVRLRVGDRVKSRKMRRNLGSRDTALYHSKCWGAMFYEGTTENDEEVRALVRTALNHLGFSKRQLGQALGYSGRNSAPGNSINNILRGRVRRIDSRRVEALRALVAEHEGAGG